jgi:hypothetical protein
MDIVCEACGSEELVRDSDAAQSVDIPLLCLDCGWRGRRTPEVSCPRCGSTDVDETPIDGWAYADTEEAREEPKTAAWGYVDKTRFKCRKCRNEWMKPGEYRPYPAAEDAELTVFRDDDEGYRAWLRSWPRGHVLNCNRNPTPDYLILHRATCRTINELGPGATTFTGEYIKVCSRDRASLRRWAVDAAGAGPTPCQLC